MPFAVRPITPTVLSAGPVPEHVGNEFDCVTNYTLAQAMRQMASLLKQADDIFGDLENQCAAINSTTKNIMDRVVTIEEKVNKLDSKKENIPSGDLSSCSKIRTHFKQGHKINKNLFTRDNRPQAIVTLYSKACLQVEEQVGISQRNSRQLLKQEKSVALSYLCIPIQSGTYPRNQKYINVETETARILNEYNLTVRGRKKNNLSGSCIHISKPEENKPVFALPSRPVTSEVVTVDVSGKHFHKMTEKTRGHQPSSKKKKSQTKMKSLTQTGGEDCTNPFEDKETTMIERERSCNSEDPSRQDSEVAFFTNLSQSESDNTFHMSGLDQSYTSSLAVTPLPDMEHVPGNKEVDTFNPFLDNGVNPFMDYKPSQKHRKVNADKKKDDSCKGCKNLGKKDSNSSTSTIFEEKNPFSIENRESVIKSFLSTDKTDVKEIKVNEDYQIQINSEQQKSVKQHSDALNSLDGLDEVVKELELLALKEQELDEEENKHNMTLYTQKPDPPKRFSSLFTDPNYIVKIPIDDNNEKKTVPLCLSVETKKRKLNEDTEIIAKKEGRPACVEHECDSGYIVKQVSEYASKINKRPQIEIMPVPAPDVVFTNKEELENKTVLALPDMLTHVIESDIIDVNESHNTSSQETSVKPGNYDDTAEESSAEMCESKPDSARAAITSSVQYRYEAPRLRITEPFVEITKEEGDTKNMESNRNVAPQLCESRNSYLQLNSWELPDRDTSYMMDQQWGYTGTLEHQMQEDRDRREQLQADRDRREQWQENKDITEQLQADTDRRMEQQADTDRGKQLQGGTGSIQQKQHTKTPTGRVVENIDKKESFFKTLKSRFGFSAKSKKTLQKMNRKCDEGKSDPYVPFLFQSTDLPRMTSTPLTRSASGRDSRGVSCNVERPYNTGRTSDCSDYPKFGGDLPVSYRTAALKNQHQRWSFAASSTSMYQSNLMLDHLLSYNTALYADMAMYTPPPPYHHNNPFQANQSNFNNPQYIYTQPNLHNNQQCIQTSPLAPSHTTPYLSMTMTHTTPNNSVYVPSKDLYGQTGRNVFVPAPPSSVPVLSNRGSYGYSSARPPVKDYYEYSPASPSPPPCPSPTASFVANCECPMCYHNVKNTCSICGCPNNTLTSKTTTMTHNLQDPLHSTVARQVTSTQLSGTPCKLQTLPSRSIQELYSQRKSSSPDWNSFQARSGTDTARTNLYKPTSLQDFKKLLSQQSAKSQEEKDNQNSIYSKYGEEDRNATPTLKNHESLKKQPLWIDNRFSIIQEEPDCIEKRRSEEDLLSRGFLV